MCVNASLTECDLRDNQLGEEGWCAVFDALRDNRQNKIAKWNLDDQGINPAIATSLAAYMAVSASLTQVLAFLPNWPTSSLVPSLMGYEFTFVCWCRWICLTTSCAALT